MNTPSSTSQSGTRGSSGGSAGNTTGNNGAMAGVTREASSLLSDLGDVVKATTHLSSEDLNRAKDKLASRANSARDSAMKFGGEIAGRVRTSATAADTYVHEQPWQAIGIGAAAGLVIGLLLARRA